MVGLPYSIHNIDYGISMYVLILLGMRDSEIMGAITVDLFSRYTILTEYRTDVIILFLLLLILRIWATCYYIHMFHNCGKGI